MRIRKPPQPPLAPARPHVSEIHGDKRIDPYHWLRGKEDPEVLDYLGAENDYTRAMMKPRPGKTTLRVASGSKTRSGRCTPLKGNSGG